LLDSTPDSDSPIFVTRGWAPTASQFPHKTSGLLEIHKNEKHFKVSHNKESHKVEVSAKDSF
jgi:hypothetical protein